MNNKEELFQEKMDEELKIIFNETGKEKPSDNFTSIVMANLETKNLASQFYAKPVISKQWWILIISIIAMLVIYSASQYSPSDTIYFFKEPFNFFSSTNYFQTFAISLSGITKALITSKWIIITGVIIGIGVFNYYLQLNFGFEAEE